RLRKGLPDENTGAPERVEFRSARSRYAELEQIAPETGRRTRSARHRGASLALPTRTEFSSFARKDVGANGKRDKATWRGLRTTRNALRKFLRGSARRRDPIPV